MMLSARPSLVPSTSFSSEVAVTAAGQTQRRRVGFNGDGHHRQGVNSENIPQQN